MLQVRPEIIRSFARREDGTVAMIFAITSFVLVGVTGLAVDLGRVMHSDRKITAAADGAALAAAKAMRDAGVSNDEATDIAKRYFDKNIEGGAASYATINGFTVRIDRRANSVQVDVDAEVRTTFGQVAGIEKIALPATSTAIYASKDIEVGLQLDVTGSMSGRKLRDLKDAVVGTHGLVDILLPTGGSTNKVRIGLAPYASGVNAGSYAMTVSDRKATNGCVYERVVLAEQTTDLPANNLAHRFKARSDLTGSGIGDYPRDAKVVAMTDDRDLITTTVNSWATSTSTAGHLGTAWAWYLISPEWSAIWPAASKPQPYNDGNTMKVAVLMTDGIYNTVGGKNNGDFSTTARESTRLALETCAAMKAKGVTVYTVGFEAPDEVKPTLTNCASDASKFFDAKDGDTLKASFRAIANEINSLRLSR